MRARSLAVVLAIAASVTLPPSELHGRAGFGPRQQKLHVSFNAFHPRFPTLFQYAKQCCSPGYVHSLSGIDGGAALIAPLDESQLPNGARITSITGFVRDASDVLDEDVLMALCRTWNDTVSVGNGDCPVVATNLTGPLIPDDTFIPAGANHRVDYTAQMDGDGLLEEVSYHLLVEFGHGSQARSYFGDELRFYQLVITFHLEVSEPPDDPSFGDVPANAAEYAFVEALAAADISEGCSPTDFCPDAPVTRRQLAVFLARALGLDW